MRIEIAVIIFLGAVVLYRIMFSENMLKRLPIFRGWQGERFVSRKLKELDPRYYVVLSDIMLPAQGRIGTAQIDHVIVSNYGVFCIETKSLVGSVYGGARSSQWFRYVAGEEKFIKNPIHQNRRHVETLKDMLSKAGIRAVIYSFVIFPNDLTLKISGTSRVGHTGETIRKIMSYNEQVYSDFERDGIVALIKEQNITDRKQRRIHNDKIREFLRTG